MPLENPPIISKPTWVDATLSTGWVAFGGTNAPPQYSIDSIGIVRVRGVIKSTSTTPPNLILTLPVGYRPPYSFTFWVPSGNTSTGGSMVVLQNGALQVGSVPNPQNYVVLDGISFSVT